MSAARLMDEGGNKVARKDIAMIKVRGIGNLDLTEEYMGPQVAQRVIDRAIQVRPSSSPVLSVAGAWSCRVESRLSFGSHVLVGSHPAPR